MDMNIIDKPKFTENEMFGFKEKGLSATLSKIDAKLKQNDTSVEKMLPKFEKAIEQITESLRKNKDLSFDDKIKDRLLETLINLNSKDLFLSESNSIKKEFNLENKFVKIIENIPFDGFTSALSLDRTKIIQNMLEISMNPYDNKFKPTMTQSKFNKMFNKLDLEMDVSLAGTVQSIQDGGSIMFIELAREQDTTQIVMQKNKINKNNRFDVDNLYTFIKHNMQVGDIVGITGKPYLTNAGNNSLNAETFSMISKPLLPKAETYDEKTLALYPELNINFERNMKMRSEIMYSIDDYFRSNKYTRVETPMLHTTAGGAAAEPFKTHHNSIGEDRHLRIAPELFLKRMMVGGLEKVYEMNRNFRNEGMDATHNPEFTSIEFYEAFSDYKGMMKHTEKIIDNIRLQLGHEETIKYLDMDINLSVPFKKISYDDSLVKIGKVNKDVLTSKESIVEYIKNNFENNNKDFNSMNIGKLKEFLFEELVEEKLINPTFITDYPIEISPLARRNDKNPNVADRFELFIGKKEYANGFSELNDPKDQYDRFKKQLEEKANGDVEAMEMDPSFITSLGYGMTSAGGCGVGIDRLTMLMGNMGSIKQAIAFPATKTQGKLDLSIGEKDKLKVEIQDIVKDLNDILHKDKELSNMMMIILGKGKDTVKNHIITMANEIEKDNIESLKNCINNLNELKNSIK